MGRASGSTSSFGRIAKRAALAGGAAIATGLGFAVKSAIDFESSFAGVRKTVDATEPQFAALARGIRNMAKEIPATTTQLNEIAESAGQLGVRREAILGFTRVIADLGETTNLVGEAASSSLARLANITRMPQKNFDRLGATIVALGNAGASTEAEIVEMGLRIAGAGKQVGMTEAEILGFANALSSVGIEAEAGGTAISRVMVDMANAVASGGEKLQGFAKVAGMTTQGFKQAFEEDAAGAIVTFVEGLGKISDEGGNVFKVLEDLGLSNVRVRDTLLRASGAGDLFRKSLALGSKAWEENTALTEEARKRYETTASQLKILRNNVADVGIAIGQTLLPMLSRGARALTGLLEQVREADGAKAKISVVLTGIRELLGRLRIAIFGGITRKPLKLKSGQIIEWETTKQEGLVRSIADGLRSVDWSGVGKRVGEGISKSIRITADFLNNALTTMSNFIDANIGQFAEIGAKIILAIFSKLLDPTFWVRNWQLVLGVAVAVFPLGRLVGLGARAASAILRGLASLLPTGFRNVGFRATQAFLGILGGLPGRVQGIILSVVGVFGRLVGFLTGRVRGVLANVPGWIRGAFRIGIFLSFVSAIQSGWNKVKVATSVAVAFLRAQWAKVPGPIKTVIGVVGDLLGLLRTLTSHPWTIILKIPRPSLPDIPGIPGFQHGVRNFRGGLAMVGERGPELLRLPHGSDVMPMRSGGGPGGGAVPLVAHITLELDGQVLWRGIRRLDAAAARNGG